MFLRLLVSLICNLAVSICPSVRPSFFNIWPFKDTCGFLYNFFNSRNLILLKWTTINSLISKYTKYQINLLLLLKSLSIRPSIRLSFCKNSNYFLFLDSLDYTRNLKHYRHTEKRTRQNIWKVFFLFFFQCIQKQVSLKLKYRDLFLLSFNVVLRCKTHKI